MPQFFQMQDIGAIIPELELAVFGMFLLIFDLLIKEKRKLGLIALIGIGISSFFLFRLRGIESSAYGGALVLDPFSIFFKLIFLIAAALSIVISLKYLDIERENHGEYYALILFSTMGMMFMAGAVDLVTAGFIWKYYLFAAAIETGHNVLAVIAVLNAAISIYFYLRIVVSMFMREATEKTGLTFSPGLNMALGVAILFTMLIGIYPDPFIALARHAVILGF